MVLKGREGHSFIHQIFIDHIPSVRVLGIQQWTKSAWFLFCGVYTVYWEWQTSKSQLFAEWLLCPMPLFMCWSWTAIKTVLALLAVTLLGGDSKHTGRSVSSWTLDSMEGIKIGDGKEWVATLGWMIQELSQEVTLKRGCDWLLRRSHPCDIQGKSNPPRVNN